MPNTNLPALPKPDTHCFDEDSGKDCWSHSPEQVRAYGQSCYEAGRVAGLEEAASVCLAIGIDPAVEYHCAKRIHELKAKP